MRRGWPRTILLALLVGGSLFLLKDRTSVRSEERRGAARIQDAIVNPTSPRDVTCALENAGPSAIGHAIELLRHRNAAVRAGAAAFLGLRQSRLAVPHQIRCLRDPEPGVRRTVAAALGLIGDPRASHFLRRVMATDELSVSEAARRASQQIEAAGRRSDG